MPDNQIVSSSFYAWVMARAVFAQIHASTSQLETVWSMICSDLCVNFDILDSDLCVNFLL